MNPTNELREFTFNCAVCGEGISVRGYGRQHALDALNLCGRWMVWKNPAGMFREVRCPRHDLREE